MPFLIPIREVLLKANMGTIIPELIQLGLAVFTSVWNLFHKSGVPTTAAPAITTALTNVPGVTADHATVIKNAVAAAADPSSAPTLQA